MVNCFIEIVTFVYCTQRAFRLILSVGNIRDLVSASVRQVVGSRDGNRLALVLRRFYLMLIRLQEKKTGHKA
jgi:hypothetical protein